MPDRPMGYYDTPPSWSLVGPDGVGHPVRFRHLDGTECVAGFDGDTGKCVTGGGPVVVTIADPPA